VRSILLQAITVLITVLSIKPVKFGQIFALASVEIDIDGVVHGIRAMRGQPMGTRVDFRFSAMQMTVMGVRRDKAALSSGCKSHPAIRSSRKQSEQSWR
jgi:hypothetical protein